MCFNPDAASDNEGGWLIGYVDQGFLQAKKNKKQAHLTLFWEAEWITP